MLKVSFGGVFREGRIGCFAKKMFILTWPVHFSIEIVNRVLSTKFKATGKEEADASWSRYRWHIYRLRRYGG